MKFVEGIISSARLHLFEVEHLEQQCKGDFRCKAKDRRSFGFGQVLRVVVPKRIFDAEKKTKDP